MSEPDEPPTVVERTNLSTTRFGEYVVMDRIATGGMGTIDLAVHVPPHGIERPVALKRLRKDLTEDAKFVAMFVDEVRIAARISHPNVVPLLNAGICEGQWFYTMDLLSGVPLSQVFAHLAVQTGEAIRSRWPPVFVRWMAEACEGLHAAHELRDERGELMNVVHRDVSPDNLFVGFDGALRVIDFGIATARDRLALTRTGVVRGKLGYIAPERLREGAAFDRRVDVWALGVTLWEGLTGRRLFANADAIATVRAIQEGRVPPIRDFVSLVPIEVEEVVARALAVDPERRFPTARALGRELVMVAHHAGWDIDPGTSAAWINELFGGAADRQRRVAEVLRSVRRETGSLENEIEPVSTQPDLALRGSAHTEPETLLLKGTASRSAPIPVWLLLVAGTLVGALIATLVWWIV
ncbi:MAG: serine/threonine-protein kinase [Sandaracinaceae bacterium]